MINRNEYTVPNRANNDNMKDNIIQRLGELWKANPEMRLSQLIGNVFPCNSSSHCVDPYHVEDFDFINRLEKSYGSRD